jgi:alkylhydroperoxidase family enzyme
MTQVRLLPVSPPYPPEVAEDLHKLMPPGVPPIGIFRTLAHNPRVLRRLRRGALLDAGAISVRERELVILRTTALCGAEYEWGVHVTYFGPKARITDAELRALVHHTPEDGPWCASERALLQAVDELHRESQLSEQSWHELAAYFDAAQITELLVLAGLYHAVSFFVNGVKLELEPGAARFPKLSHAL